MHDLDAGAPDRSLAHDAGRALEWFAPLGCILVVSKALGWGGAQQLSASSVWNPPVVRASDTPGGSPPAASNSIVILSSVDDQGAPLTIRCRTQASRFAADVIGIDPAQLSAMISNVCETASVYQPTD
ncbi:MAG: hypothetical protein JOZ81_17310 [Chloroflexi bacterium]|nr:hypothetical protein [Chloroflexota bacterium]